MNPTIYKLSVLVPVYNEESTIEFILGKLTGIQLMDGIQMELVVVNDCSTDGSDAVIRNFIEAHPDATIHYHVQQKNRGKGAAIHKGIEMAQGDCLIVQDADLEYDPREFDRLLKPMVEGYADVVYGSRFVGGFPHRMLFFWHSLGNSILTFLSNMFSNLNISDMETGYKLIRTDIAQSLELKEDRFGFEPEVTAKLARVPDIRIYEVGISYYGRTYSEGKKIDWKDGLRAVYCIFRYNLFK